MWAGSVSHQVTLHPPVFISYELFPRFLLQNNSSGGAVPCKGRQSSFFKYIGENGSSPLAGFANQFSIYLWQGRKGRVFASPCFSTFFFPAAGRCRLCSDCGLSSRVQVWREPFFLAKSVVWKLAAAAAAAPVIAEFIAARSKWVSRRKSRRNRKCINLLFAEFVGGIKASIIPCRHSVWWWAGQKQLDITY